MLKKIAKIISPKIIDGYPSEDSIDQIEKWPLYICTKVFPYIKKLWNCDYGNWEEEITDDYVRYHLITGGWSGNEAIIDALQSNYLIWCKFWESSSRGGKYIFEVEK